MSRFPFPLPYGWFSVGRLDELPDEPVTSVRYQGTDLVVWRDDAGGEPAYRVFDAYCPHLGAHLGVGGRVDDGCLVCPFHEWSFAADGTNVAIPYADRPNRKARVRAYPTAVRNGHLLFWFHPDPDVAPKWEVPRRSPTSTARSAGTRGPCGRCGRRWPRTRSTWPTSGRSTGWSGWPTSARSCSTDRCAR